jgi:Na+-translocating ferredoxin:NAD+ oxidoreductase subunit G
VTALTEALRLALIGALVAVALIGIDALTSARIDAAEQASQLQTLIEVTGDRLLAPLTGPAVAPLTVCTTDGARSYRVVAAAARGYGGEIRLLVGIDDADRVTGARAINHVETPGIGDMIDIAASDWINHFVGLSAAEASHLALSRDGGAIDDVTGATVTTRAVVAAIREALLAQSNAPLQNCSNVVEH